MKKVMTIVISYALFVLALCFLASFFYFDTPELLTSDVGKYKGIQGCLFFFEVLPAIVASGFLIGCSIIFGGSSARFIMGHFKSIIINSIVLVSLLFIVGEVVSPFLQGKKAILELSPVTFKEFLSLSKKNFVDGKMSLAAKYASDALTLDSGNIEAQELYEKSLASKSLEDSLYSVDLKFYDFFDNKRGIEIDAPFGNLKVSRNDLKNETLETLVMKSNNAMKNFSWFDAHYYAYLAVESGSPSDPNYYSAKVLAENAWKMISSPAEFVMSDEMELFKLKRLAYLRLLGGDDIGAYYSFLEISKKSEKALKDPDVMKYLSLATERVQSQFFFIDELDDYRRFESDNNVYFSIPHDDGSTDVVHICGITHIRSASQLVQYFRNFTMYSYDKNGNFLQSISAPYAKMVSEKVDLLDDDVKRMFDIKDEFKSVPYILFRGFDSVNPRKFSAPNFKFGDGIDSYRKDDILKSNFLVLPISSSDFGLICDSSVGADRMNLISLWRIFRKAKHFGYSSEIFGSTLIRRLTNSIVILIVFVFLACIAWSYKLHEGQVFKFKWVFIIPICSVILYFLLDIVHFVMRALNYFFIGVAGNYAVFVALLIEFIILMVVSFVFISKK